ncbi:hypothetical protein [Streptomyces sp. NPDC093261]
MVTDSPPQTSDCGVAEEDGAEEAQARGIVCGYAIAYAERRLVLRAD